MDTLTLTRGPHRALAGSPWVYRTELEALPAAAPGSLVRVKTWDGRIVGWGFYNPASMIAVRLLGRGDGLVDAASVVRQRVRDAWAWRQPLMGHRDAFRMIFSEADGLPGLVVDRYGPMLVVEVTSLGMDAYLDVVVETLVELVHPEGIWEHGDLPVRAREGLPRVNRLLWGRLVTPVELTEHAVRLLVDVTGGQKTGHFLDQYENRGRVVAYAPEGSRVFDAFCHTGAFGLILAKQRGAEVVGIDIDPQAVRQASDNARLNGLEGRAVFREENAFDWLRRESDAGAQYDVGILDPPAFTKSKDSVPQALKGYKEINLRALKLIRPGGYLITSSCSYHVSEADFIQVVQSAAYDARRFVRIVEIRGQGPDHPVLPALPESRYLKCLIVAVGQ
ncbi:MAG: class I SAM-dependent rRNA methyltransferase [Firmicutes bacterium]|nr:class I SAM-dependent rRNA methyltransferase [Bacillota bacterium]